jgi:hypothetical protein
MDKGKLARKRYREANRERFNEYIKKLLKNKYDNNEEYRKYMNEKAKRRYYENKDPFIAESRRMRNMLC